MADPRVVLIPSGIRELENDPGVRAFLAEHMDAVLSAAQAAAPVDSGDYRDSIHRWSATTDRAVERVAASDPKAYIIEARLGVLARALNAAGGS